MNTNWNLIFGAIISFFAVSGWVVTCIIAAKSVDKEKRCTAHTIGKVAGWSSVNYGGIHIPKVKYSVNGNEYKIGGPKFRGSSVSTVSLPFASPEIKVETNLTTKEELPLKLRAKIKRSGFVSVYTSPLGKLYPQGSDVDVYYNPKKPKQAYVQRYEGVTVPKWLAVMMLIISVALTVAACIILLAPEFLILPDISIYSY